MLMSWFDYFLALHIFNMLYTLPPKKNNMFPQEGPFQKENSLQVIQSDLFIP